MPTRSLALLTLLAHSASSTSRRPPPPITTVHVIPHSHTDPGWLKTYNQYTGDVRAILDGVVKELELSANRTFVWAETCFFQRWFDEQSMHRRGIVRALIAAGRLEFVGGG